MRSTLGKAYRLGAVLAVSIAGLGVASAQTPRLGGPTPERAPQVLVFDEATRTDLPRPVKLDAANEAAPISPKQSPGPMSLEKCLELGLKHQPAIDAAQASLSAAYSGQQSVEGLPRLLRFFRRDLGVRRQQASHGVTIAQAGLTQAEGDTRYAITRNFFTVQYVRSQQKVVNDVLRTLTNGYTKAQQIADAGNPDFKITSLDVDAIRVQLQIVKGKKSTVDNGMLKALAALREAMGLRHDYPLEVADAELPSAVYPVEVWVTRKDANGKESKKKEIRYKVLYQLESQKASLISSALANRGEMVQATTAGQITELEVSAQRKIRGMQGGTFASASDIHARPIPQGIFNNEYRPGAIGIEMPPNLIGRMRDRVQRASDLNQRAAAVVDKTTNLVSLDVEAQYLKWREAATEVAELKEVVELAQGLPSKVQKLQPKDLTSGAIVQSNMAAIMVRTQLNDALHIHALALVGLERATAGAFRVYPVPAPPTK